MFASMLTGKYQMVDQLGFVVSDLDNSMKKWSSIFDIKKWSVYDFSEKTINHQTYRGRSLRYAMQIAISENKDPEIELIVPKVGPNIYFDFIENFGYGLHHLGFSVKDISDTIASTSLENYDVVQTGFGYGESDIDSGMGHFVYLDTVDDLGVYIELIKIIDVIKPSKVLYSDEF